MHSTARAVAAALARLLRRRRAACLSYSAIGRRICRSRWAAIRGVRSLEQRGLITVIRAGDRVTPNSYGRSER